jgi:hypothetical protein
MRLGVGLMAGIVAAALAPRLAQAKPKPPPGSVLYVQKGALWRASLADPEKPEKLATLPPMRRKPITRLEASGDGTALLIEYSRNVAWIDLTTQPLVPVYLPCRGRSRLSPGGERVMCASRAGKSTAVFRMRPRPGAAFLPGFDPATTLMADLHGERVVVAGSEELWSASITEPEQRTQVAPHVPAGALSIAPDGQRAVGRYSDGEQRDSLFGFRLDGQAARRKLAPGIPVAWSADSVWIAVAWEGNACIVRAVGGEYKCWDKYRPLAIDRDGSWMLLAKPPKGRARRLDLFLGRVGGPHTEKPLKLMRGVSAATLVP